MPKLINEIIKAISNKNKFIPQFEKIQKPQKKMRTAKEIMDDYGLGGVNIG